MSLLDIAYMRRGVLRIALIFYIRQEPVVLDPTAKRLASGSKDTTNPNAITRRRMKQRQRSKPSRRGVSAQARDAMRLRVRREPSRLVLLLIKDQPRCARMPPAVTHTHTHTHIHTHTHTHTHTHKTHTADHPRNQCVAQPLPAWTE